jgi:hypothetical protein
MQTHREYESGGDPWAAGTCLTYKMREARHA